MSCSVLSYSGLRRVGRDSLGDSVGLGTWRPRYARCEARGAGFCGRLRGPGDLAAAVCRARGSGGLFLKSNKPNLSGGEQPQPVGCRNNQDGWFVPSLGLWRFASGAETVKQFHPRGDKAEPCFLDAAATPARPGAHLGPGDPQGTTHGAKSTRKNGIAAFTDLPERSSLKTRSLTRRR